MEPLWISIAFLFGFLVRTLGLPPLVGYLVAGFVLHYTGAEAGSLIQSLSDIGIMLLLFTIGLKMKIKTFLRPEIWAGATIHIAATGLAILAGVVLMSWWGISAFSGLSWKASLLVSFSMSFSSTVFAFKVLEEKGETTSLHGKIAIGLLIMQDIFAVLFLVFAAGKAPNLYALLIPLALLVMRPLLFFFLNRAGHGEMLILFGFFAALVLGGELFHLTGLKSDLGALAAGMLLAPHRKAGELAENLMGFKDMFLIGFFLSIGLSVDLSLEIIIAALIVLTALSVKVPLYFLILTRFRLRARTAFLSSLSLANFSEFGLIVASVGATSGLIPYDWLGIIAIALSLSFILASPVNSASYRLLNHYRHFLLKFQKSRRLPYDQPYDIGDAEILIFGMGRFGSSTYDQLNKVYGRKVLALDYDSEKVAVHQKAGRNVIHDDATDQDFWEKINFAHLRTGQVQMVMLCMGDLQSHKYTIERLREINYRGVISATGKYDDEVKALQKEGVDSAYNFYAEAGVGFANHVCEKLCTMIDEEKAER